MRSWSLLSLLSLLWLPALAFAGECSILVLGDSLSAGYGLSAGHGWVDLLGARVKQRFPQWQVINASISGDTTVNGLQRLKPVMDRHKPRLVIIELGANDVLRGASPEAIAENLLRLVRQAKSSGAKVVLLEIPVLPNYGKAYADALAKRYREITRGESVVFVPCFVCDAAMKPGMIQPDGLHPTDKAQPAMLEAVWLYLQSRLKCSANKKP